MTLTVLIVLFVVAFYFSMKRYARTAAIVLAIALIFSVGIGTGYIPNLLLRALQHNAVSDRQKIPWGRRTAIILLGSGTELLPDRTVEPAIFAYSRMVTTAALYRECKTASGRCDVIISGGDPKRKGVAEAVTYSPYLVRLGVSSGDIHLESSSLNTWQNAKNCSLILRDDVPADSVLLVTSGFHQWRAQLYFKHFGVDATPVRSDYITADNTVIPAAHNFTLADIALHEYIGAAQYWLYQQLRLNERG